VNRKRFVGGETVDVGKIDNAPGHAVPFFLFFKSEEKKKGLDDSENIALSHYIVRVDIVYPLHQRHRPRNQSDPG
jgi:hypothetical protein